MIVKKIRQSIVWILILLLLMVNVRLARQFPVSAAGEPLTISAPVTFSAGYTISSAQFIDTANSAYFLDPAATGTSLVTAGSATVSGTIESTIGGFKFPDGTTQTSAASAIPAGLVSFFNLSACPTGWTELTAARGMYMVGLPAAGTLAGTVGTGFTNLENRTHTHTGPSHTHTYTDVVAHTHIINSIDTAGIYANVAYNAGSAANRTITTTSTGVATGTTAASGTGATGTAATSNVIPYIQLLACQKS